MDYRIKTTMYKINSVSSPVRLFMTSRTLVCQAPLSMGFSRQEYWSGLPSPGDLPNPGIEPRSPVLQAGSLPFEPPGKPVAIYVVYIMPNEKSNNLATHI